MESLMHSHTEIWKSGQTGQSSNPGPGRQKCVTSPSFNDILKLIYFHAGCLNENIILESYLDVPGFLVSRKLAVKSRKKLGSFPTVLSLYQNVIGIFRLFLRTKLVLVRQNESVVLDSVLKDQTLNLEIDVF